MTRTTTLQTDFGPIEVIIQSDRELYLPGSELHVNVGAPFSVRASGHLKRERRGGSWTPYTSTWQVKRTDSPREPTARMEKIAFAAVQTAVATISENTLADAQRVKRTEQAREREELARALRGLANRLDTEAAALLAGGREEYHDHHHASGFTESGIRHVRTVSGILLPSLPEVKVYASHKYGPRLPDSYVRHLTGE